MGLLKEIALLPIAPVRFTGWVAQKVEEEADRERFRTGSGAHEVPEIEVARERGDIGKEERGEVAQSLAGAPAAGRSRRQCGMTESDRQLSGSQLAVLARRELAEITGLEAEGVSAIGRSEEDERVWTVTVEMLEVSRIPQTTDVLGSYEVELDEGGRLLGYRRVRRYARGQIGE